MLLFLRLSTPVCRFLQPRPVATAITIMRRLRKFIYLPLALTIFSSLSYFRDAKRLLDLSSPLGRLMFSVAPSDTERRYLSCPRSLSASRARFPSHRLIAPWLHNRPLPAYPTLCSSNLPPLTRGRFYLFLTLSLSLSVPLRDLPPSSPRPPLSPRFFLRIPGCRDSHAASLSLPTTNAGSSSLLLAPVSRVLSPATLSAPPRSLSRPLPQPPAPPWVYPPARRPALRAQCRVEPLAERVARPSTGRRPSSVAVLTRSPT